MLRALTLAFTAFAATASAQESQFGTMQIDTSAPVEIAAETFSVDQKNGQAMFKGSVVIGQGEMRLGAQEVQIDYADSGQTRIKSLHAKGKVTLISGKDAVEAEEAIYEVESGKVTLIGNVLLAQGANVLSGDRMIVDLAAGTARADGRVRSILKAGGN